MTVTYLHCVFGFLVKIDDYVAMYGYNNIPDDIIKTCIDEHHAVSSSGAFIHFMEEGGYQPIDNGNPHWDSTGFINVKRFQVGRYHYIAMSFPHDKKEYYRTHYVVGIEKPSIDIDDGTFDEPQVSNQLMSDKTSKYAVYRLAQCNIPYDIVLMIMRYLLPDDNALCNVLLEDKAWKRIIKRKDNKKLQPKMYMIPNDCNCCS